VVFRFGYGLLPRFPRVDNLATELSDRPHSPGSTQQFPGKRHGDVRHLSPVAVVDDYARALQLREVGVMEWQLGPSSVSSVSISAAWIRRAARSASSVSDIDVEGGWECWNGDIFPDYDVVVTEVNKKD